MAKSTASKKSLTSKEIAELRAKHLLPSTMTYFTEPINIVKGEMQYVYDDAGKKYLDGFSAVVTISVGHCHPDIVPKIQAQVSSLQHMTTLYFHPNIALYAKKNGRGLKRRKSQSSGLVLYKRRLRSKRTRGAFGKKFYKTDGICRIETFFPWKNIDGDVS